MAQVFTIGHSTGTVSELLRQVRSYFTARSYLIDVRSIPYSAHAPQFNADTLPAALRAAGLHYVGMGRELGARRSLSKCMACSIVRAAIGGRGAGRPSGRRR